MEKLSEGLGHNFTLKNLSLVHCRIGDDGAKALSGALKCSSIEVLDLDENRIGDRGAEALGTGLWGNISLRKLILTENRIENVRGLSWIVKGCSALESLHLELNPIATEEARKIPYVDGLKITGLWVDDN